MTHEQSGMSQNRHAEHGKYCDVKCISWRAIAAGALVAIGLGFLLNVFGLAIGLSAFTTDPKGMSVVAIGGYLGMLIGVIATMYFAGWVTGYLARAYCYNQKAGLLYGFSAWALALVLSILLAANVSDFIALTEATLVRQNMVDVQANENREAPTVSTQRRESATTGRETTEVAVNPEKATRAIGISLLLTFILFFVGAIFASYGGYIGVGDNRNRY